MVELILAQTRILQQSLCVWKVGREWGGGEREVRGFSELWGLQRIHRGEEEEKREGER